MLTDIPRNQLDAVLFNALRAIYKFQQSKVEAYDLDYEDIYLLQYLRNNSPTGMGEIAREMNIPISTATRTVDRLQNMNLISRKKNAEDKRNILVMLERKGETAVRKIEDHTYKILLENLKGYSDEDIASFLKTAMHLEKILKID
jgi:MarR family transcriptional regulator, organic hydroperoxide resistance regulator